MNPALTACSTSGSGEEAAVMAFIPTSECDGDVRTVASNEMQYSFERLLPDKGEDVTMFLLSAAFAINGREADLARAQGVSRSTQSTWKKRGIIPEQHLRWFRESLVPAALVAPKWRSGVGWFGRGLPIALAIFDQTDFNPYNRTYASRAEQMEASHVDMHGLANIGAFVHARARRRGNVSNDHSDLCGYLAQHTLELARLGTRRIELGIPTPARDEAGNFLWPDGTTTGGTTPY